MRIDEAYETVAPRPGVKFTRENNYRDLPVLKKPEGSKIWRDLQPGDFEEKRPGETFPHVALEPGMVLIHKMDPRLSFVVETLPKTGGHPFLASARNWVGLRAKQKENPLPGWFVALTFQTVPPTPQHRFSQPLAGMPASAVRKYGIEVAPEPNMEKILRNLEHIQELSRQRESLMGELHRGIRYEVATKGTIPRQKIKDCLLPVFGEKK